MRRGIEELENQADVPWLQESLSANA
jgi:hypothetical protein